MTTSPLAQRTPTARVLTLTQPWASLIALGEKRIETRSWSTKYRGPLVIHASAQWNNDNNTLWHHRIFRPTFEAHGYHPGLLKEGCFKNKPGCLQTPLPISMALGWCELLDVVPTDQLGSTLDARERAFGNYGPDRYGWLLGDFTPFSAPQPAPKGFHLGLWKWYDALPAPDANGGDAAGVL